MFIIKLLEMSKNRNESEPATQYSNERYEPESYTLETATKIKEKYKGRIPALLWEIGDNLQIRKRKFIVPVDITMGQFLYVLRKQVVNINSSDGLFLFITDKNIMIPTGDIISTVYDQHNVDGFLRFTITKENTFG